MQRRNVLLSGLATLVGGCAVGATPRFDGAAQRWPPIGRFVDIGGARIHAWEEGAGTPVVLLHGASGNLRDWTWARGPEIARTRRAIAMDRPGMGYSDRVGPMGGDPAVQARALMAAARAMGIERPILVGHSWGAAVALAWAIADPKNVAGIVTVSGTIMPWSKQPILAERLGLDALLVGAYFNYVRATAARDGVRRFVTRIFRPQTPPDGYTDYVGGPLALRPQSLAANKEDVRSLNAALRRMQTSYGALDMPIEVISGTEDFIIEPDRQPIPFTRQVRTARLTLLDGVGHMAHQVAPDALHDALDRLDPPA